MPAHDARVAAVSTDGKHRFSKTSRPSIALIAGHGVEGDAHGGEFVKHRHLARRDPRMPNLRQVHLMPSETLRALCDAGYDVGPGELGENITTTGIDLEALPVGTALWIGASALVRLTGLRTPCVLIDRFRPGLKSRLVRDTAEPRFMAGVMGIVIEGGDVSTGDAIQIELPEAPYRPLPAL